MAGARSASREGRPPRYMELRPPGPLGVGVEAVWTSAGRVPPGFAWPQRVMPDGCMDILFDLDRGETRVVGAMTSAELFSLRGRIDLLGIRFRAGGLSPLLGVRAAELTDRLAEPVEVLADPSIVEEVGERLAHAPPGDRMRLAAAAAADWLAAAPPPDRTVLRAAELLRERRGRGVGESARSLGLSLRTLERRYRRHVGLTPGLAARIERFREALAAVASPPMPGGLSGVAYATGYADQAHLTRDFGELAGITPGRWREARRAVAFVQDSGPFRS